MGLRGREFGSFGSGFASYRCPRPSFAADPAPSPTYTPKLDAKKTKISEQLEPLCDFLPLIWQCSDVIRCPSTGH
eukprot:2654016-Rhodomonas_salina.2